MKKITSLFILCGCIISTLSYGQNNPVLVTGIIIDSETKEPVKARVYYESLPYGSKVGLFNNTAFEFKMEDGDAYELTMKSQGYLPLNIKVSSAEADSTRSIERTFEMTANGIGKVVRLEALTFGQNKSNISSAAHDELDKLAQNMVENPNMIIQLEGHTDFRGNSELGMKLSEKRVEATKAYIVKKGVSKKRVLTKGFGGTQPLSRSNDANSRLRNRRVEVRIIQN
jgi:outer membrane protein OmpA-like peptidoglycan-associated protein